jgi:transposase
MAGTPSAPLQLRRRLRVAMKKRARSLREPYRIVMRARIIVLACEGLPNAEIARRLRMSESVVRKWRGRVEAHPKVSSLEDAHRSGRPPRVPVAVRCELVKLACARPADKTKKKGKVLPYAQVWTRPLLRKALLAETGQTLSLSEISRTLHCGGLRPHRVRLWLHSPDPEFRPKVERVCELYRCPPRGSTVLCIDEKPGMQALEHLYPMHFNDRAGVVRREFEYIRHGTSTLIAAFNVGTGSVFGRCRRRTAEGLVRFMEELAARYPRGDVYVIWDNLNIHHGPRWEAFNARQGGRFHFVHTPKHASWVNQVEIWFSLLARAALKNASFASLHELETAVRAYIAAWNRVAHPFQWTFRGDFKPPGRLLSAA